MLWSHIVSWGVHTDIISQQETKQCIAKQCWTLTTQLTNNTGEDEGDREDSLLMRLLTSLATSEMCGENSPHTRYKLKILLHRYLLRLVCCVSIHNSQEMEATYRTLSEGINKKIYTPTMGCYLFVKKSKIIEFPGEWIELEKIIWSQLTQIQKDKYQMFPFFCVS